MSVQTASIIYKQIVAPHIYFCIIYHANYLAAALADLRYASLVRPTVECQSSKLNTLDTAQEAVETAPWLQASGTGGLFT